MPLFIVRHQHAADRCPAQDPFLGASLLNYLSRPNVRKFGVQIHGEAVAQGEHTMFLIVEAAEESRLREFMQPFQSAGSLDIYPASTCVRAVASGWQASSGSLAIRGVAWSGAAPIARVEVSVNGGDWQAARLVSERNRNSWQWWELLTRVDRSANLVLRAPATDLAGRTQPERAEWNRLGYGNNAIQEVPIRVS